MLPVLLGGGLIYQPVVSRGRRRIDRMFKAHLATARSGNDPLAANYTLDTMARFVEYGFVYKDDPTNLVYMTGIEDFGNDCYRAESRTFVAPAYRRRLWRCPDNYQTSALQISRLFESNPKLVFKSREAVNGAGIAVSIKQAPHLFGDWVLHPSKIELRYANNWQFIIYRSLRGDVKEQLTSLEYQPNGI